MKEIEVKAKVRDVAELIGQLQHIGCALSAPVSQHDTIFVHQTNTDPQSQTGRQIFRIRQQDNKNILTLKIHQSNELESVESEVSFSDVAEMKRMLGLLGFVPTVEVAKKRQTGHVDSYEICLDEVAGLGHYIEVETFSAADPETVQAELWQFLQQLGVRPADQETRGYDTLMRKLHEN